MPSSHPAGFRRGSLRPANIILALAILFALCPGAALAQPDTGATQTPNLSAAAAPDAEPDLTAGPAVSAARAARFVVSLSKQHCWLYRGGKLIASWACSTGRRGSPTSPGTFRVQSKIRNAYGATWNFYMPYWLGIYWVGRLENGIHGLPYSRATGKTYWGNLIGTRISYGCVVLSTAHARTLWNTAYVGMPVVITR